MDKKLVDELSVSADAAVIAKDLLEKVETSSQFVLWLTGDLGAGKTTTAREILLALGLPKEVPVLSPTFTYLTEYRIDGRLYGHMDLYRLPQDDEDSLYTLLEGRDYNGLLVEWPERVGRSELITPTNHLNIEIIDSSKRLWTYLKL